MDPISTAIIAILTGVTSKLAESAVLDGYKSLKQFLKRKLGVKHKVLKAINLLEEAPDSPARQKKLQEEILTAKIDQDKEISEIAKLLLESLQPSDKEKSNIQTTFGSENIQIADSVNINITKTSK